MAGSHDHLILELYSFIAHDLAQGELDVFGHLIAFVGSLDGDLSAVSSIDWGEQEIISLHEGETVPKSSFGSVNHKIVVDESRNDSVLAHISESHVGQGKHELESVVAKVRHGAGGDFKLGWQLFQGLLDEGVERVSGLQDSLRLLIVELLGLRASCSAA